MSDFGIYSLPLWGFFVLAFLAVGTPFWIGHAIGRKRLAKSGNVKDETSTVITGALMSLLAFMLAFTFSMAASRYEERRHVVLEEANAIGTAFLRTDLLAAPEGPASAQLFRDYAEMRLSAVSVKTEADLNELIQKSTEVQGKLWALATAAAAKNPTAVTGLYISALNEVIDVHEKRVVYGARSSIPVLIWLSLIVLATLSLMPLGHHGANTTMRLSTKLSLVAAFAVVLTLVYDLDNPSKGNLMGNQSPLIDLVAGMKSGG